MKLHLLAAALATCLSLPALAACKSPGQTPRADCELPGSRPASAAAAKPGAPAAQASRIFIDPVTGEQREPTPEEIRALQQSGAKTPLARAAAARSRARAVAPREMVNADGAVGVDASDEQASFVVATQLADGTVQQHCVQGPAAAKAATRKSPGRRSANPSQE